MTHSKHRQNHILLFSLLFFFLWKENFNFFYFYVFLSCSRALCISCCSENMSPSRSPDGIAQQCQDKQVPVLRLFSVSVPFGTELHTSLPSCRVHGKYIIHVFTQHKLNTLQWQELKGKK